MSRRKISENSEAPALAQQRHQPGRQLDFGANFHTDNAAPIHYEMRPLCANGVHDIAYLSSYIHDAEIRFHEIKQRDDTFVIPLKRARWELVRDRADPVYISSELRIWPVKHFYLELAEGYSSEELRSRKLIVYSLQRIFEQWWKEADGYDDEEIVITCKATAKLRFRVPSWEFTIRLLDLPS